ncbi:anti-sigma factor family protein [Streptomyces sp. NPDC057616]|uniref:anti-sigma factor family protein n=1 Tax=Streptomyces sp. NPDC057616 TaxID=3346183 RepID=UPI0036778B35
MTSTTDMAGHPDVTEISDLTEGLLEPSRTAAVRQHLEACELCADVYASLEEIRGVLGSLPGPTRMPTDVAERIDAALAAEALLSATAPGDADAPALVSASSSSTSTRGAEDDGDRDGAHVSRETSTADRPAGHARTSTTGPGRKRTERRRSGRRRIAVLGTVFTVAALGLGSVLLSTLDDGNPPSNQAQGRQSATADTFSEGKLGNQIAGLLKGQSSGSGSHTPHSLGVEGGTNQPKVFKEPTVPPCVQKGIGRSDPALATQQGTYKGTDALLVVMPDPSVATRVNAYIVDTTCVTHPSSVKAKVLLKHSYTRP